MTAAFQEGLRRRLWPRTFAGRLTLVLVIGVLMTQALGLLVLVDDRREVARELDTMARVEQLAAVLTLLERTRREDRDLAVRAVSGRTLAVERHDRRPDAQIDPEQVDGLEAIARALRAGVPAGVEIASVGQVSGWGRDGRGERPGLLPSLRRLVVLARLSDGSWLQLTSPWRLRPPFRPFRLLVWLGLIALIVVVAGGVVARRFARPLERLAAAADRLGTDAAGEPLQVTGSSELRRAAEAFNRMQARIARLVEDRSLMLAAVAHDLRTALTRLRLRIELIEEPVQRDKAIADLEAMRQMLDETLAFARDEAADERSVPSDLPALLQTLVDNAVSAGHQATFAGPDRLTLRIRPVALRRALINLLDNALRYGQRARVGLEARPGEVSIVIDDDGPGIAPEHREEVFRPFFRLDPSRSRATGGTGLGLAVARSIVRRHGGEITLEDAPGGGLRVRVRLPA